MRHGKYISMLIITALIFISAAVSHAQGIPFLRNYMPQDYNAHNRNFDVATGKDGTIYFANFEGLLYYDRSQWRIIHTPGITRLTCVFADDKGRIWAGGFNFFGYAKPDMKGRLKLVNLKTRRQGASQSEVTRIWQQGASIKFQTGDKSIYSVSGEKISRDGEATVEAHNTTVRINSNISAEATQGQGVVFYDGQGKRIFSVTEENGLSNNNVNSIAYDGYGLLWGATDKGIFALAVPCFYTHFTQSEGLNGDVLSIQFVGNTMYAGTLRGLFMRKGNRFVPVNAIHHACWELVPYNGGLLAATSDGTFMVKGEKAIQLHGAGCMSVLPVTGGYITGEMDGVYLNTQGNTRQLLCKAEKCRKIFIDKNGNTWLQSMYGRIWMRKKGEGKFSIINAGKKKDLITTMVTGLDEVVVVNTEGTFQWKGNSLVKLNFDPKEFDFPQFAWTDNGGITWLTNAEGRQIYAARNGGKIKELEKMLTPLSGYAVQAAYRESRRLWIGGDFGLIAADTDVDDPVKNTEPELRFTNILLGDSVIWGGFAPLPKEMKKFASNERNIVVYFALKHPTILGTPEYRYRLNGGTWSSWSEDNFIRFTGLSWGKYILEIQGKDGAGRISKTITVPCSIAYPFYLRWYMQIVYLLLLVALIMLFARWRVRRLLKEKVRLEEMVEERTKVINEQKDELVRQEKMATVGKLTQGLIDRILNPLNYINNFSKLSQGLIKDASENIQEEKDHMDKEIYEDTMDIFSMLSQNLDKVQEHGMNTSRTLKAMEEILKDRSGGMEDMNLSQMLSENENLLREYYKDEIAKFGIDISFSIANGVIINGNRELLSKTIMSLLSNSIFAVTKKAGKSEGYTPALSLNMNVSDNKVTISIRDNGIGIERNILEKIFDPFFTTKTTGEAAGVGLYLSKEIVQNHHGDITVDSLKDQFTQLTIVLPINI